MDDLNDDTREDEAEAPTFRNYYDHCGTAWNDIWDSKCNDECPVCGKEVAPIRSVDITNGEDSVSVQVDGVMHTFDLPLSYEDYLTVQTAIKPSLPTWNSLEDSVQLRNRYMQQLYEGTERWAGMDNPDLTVADRCHGAVAQALMTTRGVIEGFPEPFNYPVHGPYAALHDQHKAESIKSKMATSLLPFFD